MKYKEITFKKPDYPFKLCTTTFIYPAGWTDNARVLGRAFDELELLLFESAYPASLPSPETIQTLARLSAELDFTWNIHLPIDIHPGHADKAKRRRAAEIIKRVVALTAPLAPTTHTLHLPGITGHADETAVQQWRDRLYEYLEIITDSGRFSRLTIENVPEYPLDMAMPLIEAFNLGICLDIGHLLIRGGDIAAAFETFRNRITHLHIHGVVQGRDHRSLDRLPPGILSVLLSELKDFKGVVSLEVFSKKHLLASLDCLRTKWDFAGGREDDNGVRHP